MRNTFANAMTALAKERSDVCLLSGDIGNRMFDGYKKVAPSRFLNCGVAEANMMSMATGMAMSGLRPVVYTITPFITTRCLEQIRVGVAYHEAPVVIVGTGSGLSYSELGATHHSLEDIAVMRSIPNIQVCAPTDSLELAAQLTDAIENGRPTYIRIGKKGEAILHKAGDNMGIGKASLIRKGKKTLLLGIGPIISEAIEAHDILKTKGVDLAIASMGSVKPLDDKFLLEMANEKYEKWITLEEHYRSGGLGTSIIEWLNENNMESIKLKRIGVRDKFIHKLGSQLYTREIESINSKAILNEVLSL